MNQHTDQSRGGEEVSEGNESFFRSPIFPIILIIVVDVFGTTLVLPLLPFYAQELGASPFVVGSIVAVFAFCQLIAGPILGRISDRVGRKKVLILSQIGTLIGFIVMALSHSLWLLFLARIIDGATAGNLSIAQAYISDVTKPENRTKAFGLVGIAFGVGFLIGPFLSGILAQFGYQWPAWAAAFLSLCSILCTIFMLPKVKPHVDETVRRLSQIKQITSYFSRPRPRQRLLEFVLFVLGFSMIMHGMAMYVERQFGYNATHTGYLYAFSGIVAMIVQGVLLGRLAKKVGEEKVALLGFFSMALGYGLLGYVFDLPWLLVLFLVSGFGAAIVRPALTTLLTQSVGRAEQGTALGVMQSLQSMAMMIGPVIAGWLINQHLLKTYGMVAGTFALLGGLYSMWGRRRAAAVEMSPVDADQAAQAA
jgi:MFS transporter, DHA1 family, tetracycline resistance protein